MSNLAHPRLFFTENPGVSGQLHDGRAQSGFFLWNPILNFDSNRKVSESITFGNIDVRATGIAISFTEGLAVVFQPGSGLPQTVSPNGLPITVTEGSPTVRAIARVSPNGVPITLTEGLPTVRAIARVSPNGLPITLTEGLPSLRALWRVLPSGIAIPLVPGAHSIQGASGGVRIVEVLEGRAILVLFGQPTAIQVRGRAFPLAPIGGGFPRGGSPVRVIPPTLSGRR